MPPDMRSVLVPVGLDLPEGESIDPSGDVAYLEFKSEAAQALRDEMLAGYAFNYDETLHSIPAQYKVSKSIAVADPESPGQLVCYLRLRGRSMLIIRMKAPTFR